ncbi:MAG TPA: hypothetical protein VNA30_08635 [Mycobacteriales bacterium]|nr:hypothetical protein [Mycobacteriales bacterium]
MILRTVLPFLFLAGAAAAPHAQAETLRFTYAPSLGVGSGLVGPVMNIDTPVGRLAPLANFSFVPTRSSFTLRLEDLGSALGGGIYVWIGQYQTRTTQAACVPLNGETTFYEIRPGAQVSVWLGSHLPGYSDCRTHAGHSAGGTAYISL